MIGIFDSGIGGLTVVREILKLMPDYELIYLGDTARLPYGTKSKEAVIKYSLQNTQFLLSKGAKIIVVACNTASALAGDILQKKIKIPVLNMVEPSIEAVQKRTQLNRVGIIATPATIKSGVYQEKLKERGVEVFSQACPLLVPLIEEGWLKHPVTNQVLEYYLQPLEKKEIDTLLLACTHFPLILKQIRAIIEEDSKPNVTIINPAQIVAKKLRELLKQKPQLEKNLIRKPKQTYFVTDTPYRFQELSKLCLGKEIEPNLIQL